MRQQNQFDYEASGSRFTMRPALAVQFGGEWREESERRSGVAKDAVAAEFGADWLEDDEALGDIEVLDGVRGRGAAGWIPVLEWLGTQAAGGVVQLAAGSAVIAALRRLKAKIEEARSKNHRVLVSRGLAVLLAMQYVLENTEERVLDAEFAQEPSVLGGRPPSEASYTGLEPWIVSLVNGTRRMRYVVVVSAEGEIQGMAAAEAGKLDPIYGLLPPIDSDQEN